MGPGLRPIVALGAIVLMAAGVVTGIVLAGGVDGSGGTEGTPGALPGRRVTAQAPAGDPIGEVRTETVGLAGAAGAEVVVELDHGDLQLAGGTLAGAGAPLGRGLLLRGEFAGGAGPEIGYEVAERVGRLRLAQPDDEPSWPWRDEAVVWQIFLNPTVPTDLRVEVGAGESRLALGGLTLTGLDVSSGAGPTLLDLTGDWRRSLSGRVAAGAGDLTLRLPRGVGVKVEVDQGWGELEADGFLRRDGAYVNPAYGEAPVTIELRVEQGAGNARLELVG